MENRNQVVAVHKDDSGNIQNLKLSSGNVITLNEAIQMAKDDALPGYNVGKTRGRHSHEVLRGDADGDPSNNLDNLPEF